MTGADSKRCPKRCPRNDGGAFPPDLTYLPGRGCDGGPQGPGT